MVLKLNKVILGLSLKHSLVVIFSTMRPVGVLSTVDLRNSGARGPIDSFLVARVPSEVADLCPTPQITV